MRITITLAMLGVMVAGAAACGRLGLGSPGVEGEVVTVEGIVRSVDTSPMAYDGPAEIRLRTNRFGPVVVYVQSCLGGCALEAVNRLGEVEVGEIWRVTGEVQVDGSLSVYTDREHGLLGLSER